MAERRAAQAEAAAEVAIEVAYALAERQEVALLSLPAGSTVRDAIEASGLLGRFPDIDLAKNRVGIFGRLADLETALEDRDRVEIYRPLAMDAKEARRLRAAKRR